MPLTAVSVEDGYASCVRPPASQGRRGGRPDGDRSGPCAAPATGDGGGDGRAGALHGRTRDTSGSVDSQHPASGGSGAAAEEPTDMGRLSLVPVITTQGAAAGLLGDGGGRLPGDG